MASRDDSGPKSESYATNAQVSSGSRLVKGHQRHVCQPVKLVLLVPLQVPRPLKMDDMPSLRTRNANSGLNQIQNGTAFTQPDLAPTVSSTGGSPFTNSQGLGSLASTVLPGMWRRASQPVPDSILDEVAPIVAASYPEQSPPVQQKPKPLPSAMKKSANKRPSRLRVPALSAKRPVSRQLSSAMSYTDYEPAENFAPQDTNAKKSFRFAILVCTHHMSSHPIANMQHWHKGC